MIHTTQIGLIPSKMQEHFSILKFLYGVHQINILKEENFLIISLNGEKALIKSAFTIIAIYRKLRIEEKFFTDNWNLS